MPFGSVSLRPSRSRRLSFDVGLQDQHRMPRWHSQQPVGKLCLGWLGSRAAGPQGLDFRGLASLDPGRPSSAVRVSTSCQPRNRESRRRVGDKLASSTRRRDGVAGPCGGLDTRERSKRLGSGQIGNGAAAPGPRSPRLGGSGSTHRAGCSAVVPYGDFGPLPRSTTGTVIAAAIPT